MRIESFLAQSPIFQVNRISRQMGASLNLIFAEEGLTVVESLILAAIFFEKKRAVTPSQMAETFQTTRGNVSHCISSLEAKGLVERRVDPDDARAFRLVLRPAGRRKAVRAAAILDRLQRRIEDEVGVDVLQTMLEQMSGVERLCRQLSEQARPAKTRDAAL